MHPGTELFFHPPQQEQWLSLQSKVVQSIIRKHFKSIKIYQRIEGPSEVFQSLICSDCLVLSYDFPDPFLFILYLGWILGYVNLSRIFLCYNEKCHIIKFGEQKLILEKEQSRVWVTENRVTCEESFKSLLQEAVHSFIFKSWHGS